MRPSTILFSLLAVASSVVYATPSGSGANKGSLAARSHHHRSHAHHVRRSEPGSNKLKKRAGTSKKKRCKAVSTSTGAQAEQTTSTKHGSGTSTAHATTTTSTSSSSTATGDSGSGSSNATGILKVQDSRCGPNGATTKTTETTGPNGSIDFMNCGIAKGKSTGWNPPKVTMDDVITMDLSDALQDSKSPFKACSKYLSTFKTVAAKYNIPSIVLASFALQESSCNPKTTGGGGEVGMFQLSEDKCPGGKSSSACFDVDTNTDLAGKFIQSTLKSMDNNAFALVGSYNGWFVDMTFSDATKAANGKCCRCQNNLDYLMQFWNGWVLNIDAYNTKLGKYFNLDKCPNDGANGRRSEVPRTLTLREMNPVKGGWRF